MKSNKSKIEIIRIILDILVISIMVFGVYVALNSNKTSSRALQAQYIPWVGITDISTSFKNETFFVAYGVHNFATAPATNIKIVLNIGNVSSESERPPDTLFPNTGGKLQFRIHGNPEVHRMYQEVMRGEVTIKFTITYTDIFGNEFKCITQTRYDGKVFRNDSFEVNGIKKLFE